MLFLVRYDIDIEFNYDFMIAVDSRTMQVTTHSGDLCYSAEMQRR